MRMERSFAEAGTVRKSCLSSRLKEWPNQCFEVRLIIEKRSQSSIAYERWSWRSDRSLKDGAWASCRFQDFGLEMSSLLDYPGLPAVIFAPRQYQIVLTISPTTMERNPSGGDQTVDWNNRPDSIQPGMDASK
jgi:hypothetical protein